MKPFIMNIIERIYILTSLLVLTQHFCKAQNKNIPVVLISETKRGNDIFLNYQDVYGDIKTPNFRFSETPNDRISPKMHDVKLLIDHPTLLMFNALYKQYPLYVTPGDTVYINTDITNKNYYEFKNKNNMYQLNFFNHLADLGYGVGYPESFGRELTAANCIRNADLFLNNYNKRKIILKEYNETHHLDSAFYDFAKNFIKQFYIQALLSPYWEETREYKKFPQEYVNIINKNHLNEFLEDSKWIHSSSMSKAVLAGYIRLLSRDALYTANEFEESYHNTTDSLNGEAKDYVEFYLIKNNINSGSSNFKKIYKDFRKSCSFRKYIEYTDSLIAMANGLTSIPKLLSTELETETGVKLTWNDILMKNKGNVLYVDLWASWCGPCLAQMPFSKKMEKELANKPVKFISMSVDSNKNKWISSLNYNKLNNPASQNYLLSGKSNLAIYLKAPPIPQYVLIDKKGMVISLNAARPEDPNALKEILKLVE